MADLSASVIIQNFLLPALVYAEIMRSPCLRASSFAFQSDLLTSIWWRHLAVQVGTTKDQGLYNKP